MAIAMDLSALTKKTHTVTRGYTYTYYTSRPSSPTKPTIALFHGWPDCAFLWSDLINKHLLPLGYGIIAPDCLGYAGTSKPTSPAEYSFQSMTADFIELLDAESIPQIISLGHDWGSAMAQRVYNYYPDRVVGLVIINAAYIVPMDADFDLHAVNKATREVWGHGIYEFWSFFTAPDAPKLMNQQLESVYTVAHGDPSTWLDNWVSPGGMRKYIESGKTQETLKSYASEGGEHRREFMERFQRDGFEAPQCWYRAYFGGVQNRERGKVKEVAVDVPVLFWGGSEDHVCKPEALQRSVDGGLLKKGVKKIVRKGGHWALLERPEEFGKDVVEWLEETYGA